MSRPKVLKDIMELRVSAQNWAEFLFALRDGLSGIYEVAEWEPVPKLRGAYRMTRVIEARIIDAEKARKFPSPKTPRQLVIRPVVPAPKIWERFTRANSEAAIRAAIRAMHTWAQTSGMLHGVESGLARSKSVDRTENDPRFAFLASHAGNFRRARRLWNYPRTNRPRSDDKRVNFFAKVFAGLELGIAPATATKRLQGVHFMKEDGSQQRQRLVELWKKHWKKSLREGEGS